jgi:hypothetical protein
VLGLEGGLIGGGTIVAGPFPFEPEPPGRLFQLGLVGLAYVVDPCSSWPIVSVKEGAFSQSFAGYPGRSTLDVELS